MDCTVTRETIAPPPIKAVVLTLTPDEAVKLYNITCFVFRSKSDSSLGVPSRDVNYAIQRLLNKNGVKPDYDLVK